MDTRNGSHTAFTVTPHPSGLVTCHRADTPGVLSPEVALALRHFLDHPEVTPGQFSAALDRIAEGVRL